MPVPSHPVRLSDLSSRKPTRLTLEPDAAGRTAIAEDLSIRDLPKLRFVVELRPIGRTDWHLTGDLGATVVQDCVVTLDPVTTRIDEPVERRYLADMPEPTGEEIEMPEDDTAEALPATLDLAGVMIEALALALPPYPRRPDAEPADTIVTEPGVEPLTDERMRPFAGLAGLRDSLAGEADDKE